MRRGKEGIIQYAADSYQSSVYQVVKNEPKHLDMLITRELFNELTDDLVKRTDGPVNQALRDAGISAGSLDKVLLVGGSTRIPAVMDEVKRITGKSFRRISTRMSALRWELRFREESSVVV